MSLEVISPVCKWLDRSPKNLKKNPICLKMALIWILLIGLAGLVIGAERVALVIGNNAYTHGGVLENPVNDAKAVKLSLESVGFQVTMITDASHQKMEGAVTDFRKAADGAEAALFYYAGHGLEVGGRNYLVPIDAKVEEEYQVKHRTMALDLVLGAMDTAKVGVRVVILDCCRDNPLGRVWNRSGAAGLKATDQLPDGTVLVFAAAPGQLAADGAGENSPFTAAFVHHVVEPGMEVEQVFKRVGQSVAQETFEKQRPWINSNFYGRFVFQKRDVFEAGRTGEGKLRKGNYAGEKWELMLPGGIPMAMRWIPPTGSEGYIRGSPESEEGRSDDEEQHRVILTDGFWMAETEVTQSQWEAVMGRSQNGQVEMMLADQALREKFSELGEGYEMALKSFSKGDEHPVSCVNIEDISEFSRRVQFGSNNQLQKLRVKLPTEAEWEWACRAGSQEATYAGDLSFNEEGIASNLDRIAWHMGNSTIEHKTGIANFIQNTRKVATRKPNSWGLFDMIGNVNELCEDWYGTYPEGSLIKYPKGALVNPGGLWVGKYRVVRGGNCSSSKSCRSASRSMQQPDTRSPFTG